MTHRDRAGDPPGRREAAGDAGDIVKAFRRPPIRPLPVRLPDRRRFPKAFGRPITLRGRARLPMSRIATPRARGRMLWEAVSMGHYQGDLV